jgi:hypothetical protein
MSLTKLSLCGNNDVIYKLKLVPPRESLVIDIPAGDGNIEKLFLQYTRYQGGSGEPISYDSKKARYFSLFCSQLEKNTLEIHVELSL